MTVKTISTLADVQDAIYQALLSGGFTVTKPDDNNVKVDFSGDADWVGVNDSLWFNIRLSGGQHQYRVSNQPASATTFDTTKVLTGSNDSYWWMSLGAIGDTITYSAVAGFAAFAKNTTADNLPAFSFLWKSTSPIDSQVRFYIGIHYGWYDNYPYENWIPRQLSPVVQDCVLRGIARRTIMGDGISYQTIIEQVSNGMAIDRCGFLVPWRSDLSLIGNNFTLGTDTYHYIGTWGRLSLRSGQYAGDDSRSLNMGFRV